MSLIDTAATIRFGLVTLDWTFLMQLANTLILFLILKHFLFKPVTAFMENREKEIKDQISSAEKLEEEAQAFKAEYEARLAKAEEEGKELIKTHIQRGENRAFEIIKAAESDVESMKLHAHRELETERIKAVNELKDQISELSVMAASKVIDKDLDESSHKDLIDKFINEVGETQWQN
ncbi:F0F1 ATP synthase subunit B [Fusibacter sp. JL298sf-3]